jgi:hypothetical protein
MSIRKAFQAIRAQFKDSSVRWFFARCILSRIKRKDLNFFRVVLIFTELGQNLTHLTHKENTQSEMFLLGRLEIVIAFCYLRAPISWIQWYGQENQLTLLSLYYKNCDIFAKICERSSMEEDLEEKALVIIDNGGYGNEC